MDKDDIYSTSVKIDVISNCKSDGIVKTYSVKYAQKQQIMTNWNERQIDGFYSTYILNGLKASTNYLVKTRIKIDEQGLWTKYSDNLEFKTLKSNKNNEIGGATNQAVNAQHKGETEQISSRELYNTHLKPNNKDFAENEEKNNDIYYQLVFDIKHCVFKAGNDTILLFSIFDDTDKNYVTEEYCLHLSENNFPKVGSPEDCKVLFKDLTYDIFQHAIYIICRIYRTGPMDAPDNSKSSNAFRSSKRNNDKSRDNSEFIRPYAVTLIRVKDCIPMLLSNLGEERMFEPGTAPICCPKDESGFCALPFDLITERKNTYYHAPLSVGIAYGLRLYVGNVSVVENNYEYWDKLTLINTLSIDAALNTERHLLYITMHDVHVNQRSKRAACNICVKMQLRDNATYKAIPGCMMLGKGRMAVPTQEATSPTYYHNNDPTINQTYNVLIPNDIKHLEHCHLYFSFWHNSSRKKPESRGFAFVKLFHDKLMQIMANNQYELPLYRNDKKVQSAYLHAYDSLRPENKLFRISFQLSSTKIYSNIDIHQVLTWRQQNDERIVAALRRTAKQPILSLLTILHEFMQNIFEMMLETSDSLLLEELYSVLTTVLGEVNKSNHMKYKPRVEEWIEVHFKYPNVWRILSTQQLRLFQWIASPEAVNATSKDASVTLKQRSANTTRQLLHSARAIKLVFSIMKRSCEIEINDTNTIDGKNKIMSEYNQCIATLLSSMNRVMSLESPKTVVGVQSFTLRNFLSLLDFIPVQTSTQLTQIVVKFIHSIRRETINLSVEKLLLIRRCLESPKLKRIDIVNIFLPSICKLLFKHIHGSSDERILSATIVQKCIAFLDPARHRSVIYDNNKHPSIMPLEKQPIIPSESLYDEFTILLLKMFGILDEIRSMDLSNLVTAQKIFGKSIKKNKKESNTTLIISNDQLLVHQDIFITIADLSHVIISAGTKSVSSWDDRCVGIENAIATLRTANESEVIDLIDSVLRCCNNLLTKSLFPNQWIVMRMVEAEVAMLVLSWFTPVLKKHYLSKSFEIGRSLWKHWLDLGVTYLSNEDFQLEDMNELRASIIMDNYGDIRNIAIKKLIAAWDILTPHRATLADTMISVAVKSSASEVQEIQEFALNVYFEMMKSEFETSNEMMSVQTHTIEQIEELTQKYSHKERVMNRYLDFFRIRIKRKINGANQRLKKMGNAFLSDVERLYDYLVQLKQIPNTAEYEDERASTTIQLLGYLHSYGKDELYNKYLYNLGLMHQALSNHTEAAICFQSCGDRLGWTNNILDAHQGLEAVTEWKRHIVLYEFAHKHFMLGEQWELAVRVLKQLSTAYNDELYDLKALASTLEKQAHLQKLIGNHDRVFHEVFAVRFKGKFSNKYGDDLHNKSFIYRSGNGKYPESVRSFTERIKKKYKNAKIVNSTAPIDALYDERKESNSFIQIIPLKPSSTEEYNGGEWKWDSSNLSKVPPKIKRYYRNNETATYCYTNAIQKRTNDNYNEFGNFWVTKTFVVCEDMVPSNRRRIPIISEKLIEYTPLQTAINKLVEKTNNLQMEFENLENNPTKSVLNISMILNGILDAAVSSDGVAKVREAFFDGTYLSAFPDDAKIVSQFVTALKEQMGIAKTGLDAYQKYASKALQPHVEHLKTMYTKQKIQLSEFYKETKKYSQK